MKDCNNCGNNECHTKINHPEEYHTSPPCTGWKPVKHEASCLFPNEKVRNKVMRMAKQEISEELKTELDELAEFYEDYDPLKYFEDNEEE